VAGKPLKLVGVNACYETITDTIVDQVQIEVAREMEARARLCP